MRKLGYSSDAILSVVEQMAIDKKIHHREVTAARVRKFRGNECNAVTPVTQEIVTDVTQVTDKIVTEPPVYKDNSRADALISNGSSFQSEPVRLEEKPNPLGLSKAERKPLARKSSLAEDAQPTDADKCLADEARLTPSEFRDEWRAFRDFHCSRGTLMKNWHLAWATWLRNGKRFKSRAGPQRAEKRDAMNQAAVEIMQELNDEIERETRSCNNEGATIIDIFATSR